MQQLELPPTYRVDGRYLSQETAASFTGRVIGPFAVTGEPAFTEFSYLGR